MAGRRRRRPYRTNIRCRAQYTPQSGTLCARSSHSSDYNCVRKQGARPQLGDRFAFRAAYHRGGTHAPDTLWPAEPASHQCRRLAGDGSMILQTPVAAVDHSTVYAALPDDEAPFRVQRTEAVPAPFELVPMTSVQETNPEWPAVFCEATERAREAWWLG